MSASTSDEAQLRALVHALPDGQTLWLRASGNSMWPVLISGDQLLVERRRDAATLTLGEIALVSADGQFIAHIVTSLEPLLTASIVGVDDAPHAEVVGRVVAVRRRGRRIDVPPFAAIALQHAPVIATVLKRVPFARQVVRFIRRAGTPKVSRRG